MRSIVGRNTFQIVVDGWQSSQVPSQNFSQPGKEVLQRRWPSYRSGKSQPSCTSTFTADSWLSAFSAANLRAVRSERKDAGDGGAVSHPLSVVLQRARQYANGTVAVQLPGVKNSQP
jgi:hypothetical protein